MIDCNGFWEGSGEFFLSIFVILLFIISIFSFIDYFILINFESKAGEIKIYKIQKELDVKRKDKLPLKLVKSKFKVLELSKSNYLGDKQTEFSIEIEGQKFVVKDYDNKIKIFYPSTKEVKKI